MSLTELTIAELLAKYNEVLDELCLRSVVRSKKSYWRLHEWLVSKSFGLTFEIKLSEKFWRNRC
jgi:hypothetical protein